MNIIGNMDGSEKVIIRTQGIQLRHPTQVVNIDIGVLARMTREQAFDVFGKDPYWPAIEAFYNGTFFDEE